MAGNMATEIMISNIKDILTRITISETKTNRKMSLKAIDNNIINSIGDRISLILFIPIKYKEIGGILKLVMLDQLPEIKIQIIKKGETPIVKGHRTITIT
jgi:hypothetical protein